MEFTDAVEAVRSSGKFTALRGILRSTPPLQPRSYLTEAVAAVEAARNNRGYIPYPNTPEPAQMQLNALRALVQPEIGMLLVTVPGGSGLFCMADGSEYVFCTALGYTVIRADKTPQSAVFLLEPGVQPLLVAAYGAFEHGNPLLTKDPVQHLVTEVEVVPGIVTEAVCTRGNVFSKFTSHAVYHW